MTDSFDVFLSHTGRHKPAVRRIAEALVDDGLSVWLDEWCMVAGESWVEALEDAITHSKSILIIVDGGEIDGWSEAEMIAAASFAVEERRPVILVHLPGADNTELPPLLRSIPGIPIKSWNDADFQDALRKIVLSIAGKLEASPKLARNLASLQE